MVSKIICSAAVMLVLAISLPQEKVADFHAGATPCTEKSKKDNCLDDLGGNCVHKVLKCDNGPKNALECNPGAGSAGSGCARSKFCIDENHASRDSNCTTPRAPAEPVG